MSNVTADFTTVFVNFRNYDFKSNNRLRDELLKTMGEVDIQDDASITRLQDRGGDYFELKLTEFWRPIIIKKLIQNNEIRSLEVRAEAQGQQGEVNILSIDYNDIVKLDFGNFIEYAKV